MAHAANLVDGTWRAGSDWTEIINPARLDEVVALSPVMTALEASEAVKAAERAAVVWRATSPTARGAVLLTAARLLRERREQIAPDITREMGKTLAEALAEVAGAANFLEFYGSLGRREQGALLPDGRVAVTAWTRREPIGVVIAITPWNDPLLTPARKLGPALIAGNTVVLKPASMTPLAAGHLVRALDSAGLPAGVVNTVTGRSDVVVPALLDSPAIAAVTFTGSTFTGLGLQRRLAGRNLRFQGEMGGKNFAVVMADADLDLAATTIAKAAYAQAGQRCTATSRLLVEATVASQLLDRLAEEIGTLRIGDGLDPTTTMGPVAGLGQLDGVLSALKSAHAAGAHAITGGQRLSGSGHDRGCFVAPTLLAGVRVESDVWRQEIFGPVLAAVEFTDFDQAIALANDSEYGLSGSIFTTNLRNAHRFIEAADVGQVAVNLATAGWDVHLPFGGFKASGSPFKEQGVEALSFYSRTKTVALNFGGI
jgi:acyl-CoA reductase-like NAD-dependent aldehyde dehydrogenase